MAEKPLSEVADLLEMFIPEVKVPESVQNKSVDFTSGEENNERNNQ